MFASKTPMSSIVNVKALVIPEQCVIPRSISYLVFNIHMLIQNRVMSDFSSFTIYNPLYELKKVLISQTVTLTKF